MKSTIVIMLLLIVIFTAGCNSKIIGPSVDPEVYKNLGKASTVMVIVMLDRQPGFVQPKEGDPNVNKILKDAEDYYTQEINKVLETLPKGEFTLGYRFNSIGGFSGTITKRGVEILSKNSNVQRIDIGRESRIN